MAAVLSPENRIFQDLTAFLHPFIISMKYKESIKTMGKAFFKILVYFNFRLKYEASIEVAFLHHFIISMEYGGSIKS